MVFSSAFKRVLYAILACYLHATYAFAADTDAHSPNKEVKPAPAEDLSFGGYLSGRFAEESGDSDKSIDFLKKSLAKNPDSKELNYNLYRAYLDAGDIAEAIKLSEKLVKMKVVEEGYEFPPELLAFIGAVKQNDFVQAKTYLALIPKNGFNSVLVPLVNAWVGYANKTLALPLDAKDIMPKSKIILSHFVLNAAYINELAGFIPQATSQYEQAGAEQRLDSTRMAEALINFYDRKHETEKRAKYIQQYEAVHSDIVVGEIKTTATTPLVTNPTEGIAEAFYSVSTLFHGVRPVNDEITTLKLALYLRPDLIPAQLLLGNSYDMKKAYPQALATYQAIPENSPYALQAKILIGYDKNEMGEKKEALDYMDRLIASNPQNLALLSAKGDLLRLNSDFASAVTAYNQAIGLIKKDNLSDWILYFSRGICFERLDKVEESEKDMKKALALNPDQPDVLNYLGYSWLVRNEHLKEAREMIERAYDARPEDAQIIDSMGYALYTEGDFESAKEYFERALERMPDEPTVNEHLGDTYFRLNRKVEAKYQWQRALDNKPDPKQKIDLEHKLEAGMEEVVKPKSAEAGKEKKTSSEAGSEPSL